MRTALFFLLLAACDPVRSDAVNALGGESRGVRAGPFHRPGQPCLVCHDGSLGSPPEFTVAGTVFQSADSDVAAAGATVTLNDSSGNAAITTTTNEAGNFYLSPNEFQPVYPMAASVISGGVETKMTSLINGNGACGTCHQSPPGPTSAGQVYPSPDGGAP